MKTVSRIASAAVLLGSWAGCAASRDAGADGPASPGTAPAQGASLGVSTRAPTDYEGQCWELLRVERWQGRVVLKVDPVGPAAQAGVREGDVLLQIGEVTLYSQDDLADLLRVRRPGERVDVRLKRKDARSEEVAHAILGPSSGTGGSAARFAWQYASLGQLPFALKEAERTRKSVLVGLSGAET